MALRDTFISVLFDVDGEDSIKEADAEIEQTASSAQEMGNEAEVSGEKMEAAGEQGGESFDEANESVVNLSDNIGTVAATSGAVFAGLATATGTAFSQAQSIESATTRVQALAGDQGGALVEAAQETEAATQNLVSAKQALEGQAQLLGQAGLQPETVDQVTGSIATLATTMEGDTQQAFEQFADPLNEATGGFEEIINSGPLTADTLINQAQQLGLNVEKLNDFNEEMDKQTARQALINTIQVEANKRKDAAREIQSSWNSVMTRGANVLEETAAALFSGLSPAIKETVENWIEWFDALQESNPALLDTIGRVLALSTVVAGIMTVVTAAAAAFVFLGTATLLTVGYVVAIGAAITAAIIVIVDLIAFITTGKELFIDWSLLLESLTSYMFQLADSSSYWKRGLAGLLAIVVGVGQGIKLLINLAGTLISTFANLVSSAFSIGQNFVNALINGVTSMGAKLVKKVKGMVESVRSYLPFSPADTGPLSDLDKSGEALVTTVAEGVERKEGEVVESTKKTTESTSEVLNETQTNTRTARRVEGDAGGRGSGPSGDRLTLEIVDASGIPDSTEGVRRLAEELGPILGDFFSVEVEGAAFRG